MLRRIHNYANFPEIFKELNVDSGGIGILKEKISTHNFLIKNLKVAAANILKQDALSVGADVATPRSTINCDSEFVDVVLMATLRQLKKIVKKEKAQPFGLKNIAKELEQYIKQESHPIEIMGVLNLNHDSFFEKSRTNEKEILERSFQMIEDGADILDFGAVSSRPGSEPVSPQEELARAKETIDTLYKHKVYEKATLSLDSYQRNVIHYALERGFSFINDITGLENDEVCKLVGEYNPRVCIMHMQKNPKIMQVEPTYDDVVLEVKEFFKERLKKADEFNIKKIILDVGIGFGKSLEHNCSLINSQEDFITLGYPLLIGASRKSMIDKIVPTPVEDRLSGTLAIHLQGVVNGASIVRCHDVKEHNQALSVIKKIRENSVFH